MEQKYPTYVNKTKPIYLLGNDYAGSVLTNMALAMIDAGYNVKGYVISAPWSNVHSVLETFTEGLYKRGNIWWTTYQWYKGLALLDSWMLHRGIMGSHYFSQ